MVRKFLTLVALAATLPVLAACEQGYSEYDRAYAGGVYADGYAPSYGAYYEEGYRPNWQEAQREERYRHDRAHEEHVREGMYDDQREQRRERDAHDRAHWRHEEEGMYGY